uniref:Uncharacterized protein n=1 Tax=Cacopsylla melanoneura TaxID=428564 RepID=A0A8D9F9T8_9HEMI
MCVCHMSHNGGVCFLNVRLNNGEDTKLIDVPPQQYTISSFDDGVDTVYRIVRDDHPDDLWGVRTLKEDHDTGVDFECKVNIRLYRVFLMGYPRLSLLEPISNLYLIL